MLTGTVKVEKKLATLSNVLRASEEDVAICNAHTREDGSVIETRLCMHIPIAENVQTVMRKVKGRNARPSVGTKISTIWKSTYTDIG